METEKPVKLADKSVDELQTQVDELGAQIDERQATLLNEYGGAVDPLNFFHARLSALAEIMLDEKGLLVLDILTRTMIVSMIDNFLEQAVEMKKQQEQQQNRARLVEGIPGVDPNVGMPIPQGLFTSTG